MSLSNQRGDAVIIMQDEKLKIITAKLNSVIEGNGVNCVDCEATEGSGTSKNGGEDDEDNADGSGETGSGAATVAPVEGSGDSGSGQPVTKAPPQTTTTCHPNDVSCLNRKDYINKNKKQNNVGGDESLGWADPFRIANPQDSSGTMLFMNLLLLLFCAVLATL